MLTSNDRPFSSHNPEEKVCLFCNEIFHSTHGLEKYCREKYGIIGYCKNEQKKLVSQQKLADLAQTIANINNPRTQDLSPLERNIQILREIIGQSYQVNTDSDTLDAMGYDINIYSRREYEGNSTYTRLIIGQFGLSWISQIEENIFFKISKL